MRITSSESRPAIGLPVASSIRSSKRLERSLTKPSKASLRISPGSIKCVWRIWSSLSGADLVVFLEAAEILARGLAADDPVGASRKRCLIHDAVPSLAVVFLALAVSAWEDVVNVDGRVEVSGQGDRVAAQEILAASLHQ